MKRKLLPCCPVSPVALRNEGSGLAERPLSKEQLSYETAGESAPWRIGGTPLEGCTMKECVSGGWKADDYEFLFYLFFWLWISETLLNKNGPATWTEKTLPILHKPKREYPKEMQLKIFFNLIIHYKCT